MTSWVIIVFLGAVALRYPPGLSPQVPSGLSPYGTYQGVCLWHTPKTQSCLGFLFPCRLFGRWGFTPSLTLGYRPKFPDKGYAFGISRMYILFRFFFFRARFFGSRRLLKKGGSGEGTIRPLTVTPGCFFP